MAESNELPRLSDAPIRLEETTLPPGETAGKIKISGSASASMGAQRVKNYTRVPTKTTGTGAIRVRTFHGRISSDGLGFMDDKVNEWLDQHPEIEVKFVTSTIGTLEGKIREPALILNVWY